MGVAASCVLVIAATALGTGYWAWQTLSEKQPSLPVVRTEPAKPELAPVPPPPPAVKPEPVKPEPAPEPPHAPVTPARPVPKADEVSGARLAATKAQGGAREAGAEENARDLWTKATGLFNEGEAHDTLKEFSDALDKYQTAATAFSQAETAAKRVADERALLKIAQAALNEAKAEAEAGEAATYAKPRYAQAAEMEQQAASEADRVQAAKLCRDAAQRYTSAASEAGQQAEAMVGPAKRAAEDAQKRASTEDVEKYCADEMRLAETLMNKAREKGTVVQSKKESYEQAAAKFEEAIVAAPKRKPKPAPMPPKPTPPVPVAASRDDAAKAIKEVDVARSAALDRGKGTGQAFKDGVTASTNAKEFLKTGDFAKARTEAVRAKQLFSSVNR